MTEALDSEAQTLVDEVLTLVYKGAFERDDAGHLTPASRRTVESLLFLARGKSPMLREALEQAWERIKDKSG